MCHHNCLMSQYIREYKCLPNPFVYEDFVLINSSQTEHRICDRDMVFNKSEINCNDYCINDYEEVYYLTRFENPFVFNTTDTRITIRNQKSEEFQYISQIKYTFVDYMSNIGGLFGLYIGLSFVDVLQVVKSLFGKLKTFIIIYIKQKILASLYRRFRALRKIDLLISKLIKLLKYLERIN